MPICLSTAHWKVLEWFSSKRFELECSTSVVDRFDNLQYAFRDDMVDMSYGEYIEMIWWICHGGYTGIFDFPSAFSFCQPHQEPRPEGRRRSSVALGVYMADNTHLLFTAYRIENLSGSLL